MRFCVSCNHKRFGTKMCCCCCWWWWFFSSLVLVSCVNAHTVARIFSFFRFVVCSSVHFTLLFGCSLSLLFVFVRSFFRCFSCFVLFFSKYIFSFFIWFPNIIHLNIYTFFFFFTQVHDVGTIRRISFMHVVCMSLALTWYTIQNERINLYVFFFRCFFFNSKHYAKWHHFSISKTA